jgi:hypothetical protein
MVPVSNQNQQHDAVEAQMNSFDRPHLKPYKNCSNFINEAQISNISLITCDVNTRINFSCDFDVLLSFGQGAGIELAAFAGRRP